MITINSKNLDLILFFSAGPSACGQQLLLSCSGLRLNTPLPLLCVSSKKICFELWLTSRSSFGPDPDRRNPNLCVAYQMMEGRVAGWHHNPAGLWGKTNFPSSKNVFLSVTTVIKEPPPLLFGFPWFWILFSSVCWIRTIWPYLNLLYCVRVCVHVCVCLRVMRCQVSVCCVIHLSQDTLFLRIVDVKMGSD